MDIKEFVMNLELNRSGVIHLEYSIPYEFSIDNLYIGCLKFINPEKFHMNAFPSFDVSSRQFIFEKINEKKYREIFTGIIFDDRYLDKNSIIFDMNDMYIYEVKQLKELFPLIKKEKIDRVDANIIYYEINKDLELKRAKKISKNKSLNI